MTYANSFVNAETQQNSRRGLDFVHLAIIFWRLSTFGAKRVKLVYMAGKGSRRDFLKASAVGMAVLTGGKARGHQSQDPASTIDRIQKLLASPLDGEPLEIMKRTVRGNESAATARLRTKLTENSEPCTVYRPVRPGKKG